MKPSALFLLLVMFAQPSQGQRIASLPSFPAPEATTRHYPATYWFEGATIGAGLFGTTGAWLIGGLCDGSDCSGAAVTGGLLFAAVGGAAGALIGGMITAPHPRPLRGHAAKAALVGAIAGAMWGFGMFTQLCVHGCNPREVRLGLSGAAVGALAGLVVGL